MLIKLYLPYGNLKSFKGRDRVTLHWFIKEREHPILPYTDLIQGYRQLTPEIRCQAERMVDELFTEQEYRKLRAYLYEMQGEDLHTEIFVPPISVARQDNAQNRGLIRPFGTQTEGERGGFCRLCAQDGYTLPFAVWGFYTEPARPLYPRQAAKTPLP